MDITEQDILDAWGLGEEDTPEPEDTATDEELEEVTEDEDTEDEDLEDGEDTDEEEPGEEPAGEQEDPFAQERERIAAQYKQELNAALDAQLAGLGLKNPYDGGKPVTTQAERDAYLKDHWKAQWGRIAQQTGMSQEQLDELIRQHPDVVAGQQLRTQLERQQEAENRQRAERALNADLAEIGRLCPGVDSKEKLVTHESWPEVRKLMEDNPKLGLKKAFRLANADAIESAAGQKARAAAQRNAAGKSHLKGAGSRGKGLPEVPAEVVRMYKAFDPTITDAEIRRDYAKNRPK